MRVRYFAGVAGFVGADMPSIGASVGRIGAADVARAFRQIELVFEYAALVRQHGVAQPPPLYFEVPDRTVVSSWDRTTIAEWAASQGPAAIAEVAAQLRGLRDENIDDLSDEEVERIGAQLRALEAAAEQEPEEASREPYHPGSTLGGSPTIVEDVEVAVVSIEMSSPLVAVYEIPPALWPVLGSGILMLMERIATAPVRIARKRKEELLKIAELDARIKLEHSARADVLAEILRREGPAHSTGPSDVVFIDPDNPDDELADISAVG